MKRTLRICLLTLLGLILLTLSGFLALTWYYSRTFVINTWINGVYCTGMTVEEVNSELVRTAEIPELIIIDSQGQRWPVDLAQADFRVDYTDSLQEYLRRSGQTVEQYLIPRNSWNSEKLRELVTDMVWVQSA
ncbi:MAG: hypothetical protein K2H12_06570, partial [Acetatifactor sp.]|nr:hypothetical protein [Acetatifactor sp.]